MSEQPPFPGDDPTLAEIVINELAFRSLNSVEHVRSASTADALDRLTERLRQTALALYCGLSEIAQALEQRREEE